MRNYSASWKLKQAILANRIWIALGLRGKIAHQVPVAGSDRFFLTKTKASAADGQFKILEKTIYRQPPHF